MTRRLEFGKADVHYLANLCHNCGACLHACQYAPPHEFAVNVPRRWRRCAAQTYADYAWPPALGALYRRNGLTLSLALAAALALFLVLARGDERRRCGARRWRGNFYAMFPHNLLVSMFAPVFLFAVLALGMGVRRSGARSRRPPAARRLSAPAAAEATARRAARSSTSTAATATAATTRTTLHAAAPALPPLHLLRLPAVLRGHQRGHALPLRARLARRPTSCTSLPKLLGIGGRRRPADRHRRACWWLNLRRHPAARRPGAAPDGPAASSRCCS